jgi:hypothetical protein
VQREFHVVELLEFRAVRDGEGFYVHGAKGFVKQRFLRFEKESVSVEWRQVECISRCIGRWPGQQGRVIGLNRDQR